jgi:hypothetical protein
MLDTTTARESVALKMRWPSVEKFLVRVGITRRAFWIATASSLVLEGLAFNTYPPCEEVDDEQTTILQSE